MEFPLVPLVNNQPNSNDHSHVFYTKFPYLDFFMQATNLIIHKIFFVHLSLDDSRIARAITAKISMVTSKHVLADKFFPLIIGLFHIFL